MKNEFFQDAAGMSLGVKISTVVVNAVATVAFKTISCVDYLARKQRVLYLEKKFALLKKGDIIVTKEAVKLFRTVSESPETDNVRVKFIEIPENVALIVLRVAWPLVPYNPNEYQESATIEVLYDSQLWILYISQSKVFENIPFKKL